MCFSLFIDGFFGTAMFLFETGMRNPGGQEQLLEASAPVLPAAVGF